MSSYLSQNKFLRLFCCFVILIMGSYSCKENSSVATDNENSEDNTPEIKMNSSPKLATLEFQIPSQLGEGAFWNHKSNELFWVDIEGRKINIYNPESKENRAMEMPSRVGTIVPKSDEEVVVALEDGIYIFNTISEELKLLSNIEEDVRTNRFNDGKCDPSGRLWVGSMALDQSPKAASLYMIDEDGKATKQLDSITISNGIVWSKNKDKMFYIDTPTAKIRSFDYDDKTGNISNEKIIAEVPEDIGYPDGMTIDDNDKLWVGMWNGNAVLCFDPNTGNVIDKIEVPAHNVTSCAFGGENLNIIYITTASVDMTEDEKEKYPLAGSLFKIVLDTKGVKSTFFGNR